MWEQEEEFEHVATEAEADREYARNYGVDHPDREWVLSDRDVWYRNPSYRGPVGPHPEDPEPPWAPDPGTELFGFNLREVGFYLHGLRLRKDAEVHDFTRFPDDLPF